MGNGGSRGRTRSGSATTAKATKAAKPAKATPAQALAAAHAAIRAAANGSDAERLAAAKALVAADKAASRASGSAKASRTTMADFTPVKHVPGLTYNPSKPPDPYLLREAYGERQFPQILNTLSLARLKEVSAVVESRNAGTAPRSRTSKAAVIDYIMSHTGKE